MDREVRETSDIEDILDNNVDIMRDKMNNVYNRIDKAITMCTNQKHEWVKEELTKQISVLETKSLRDDDEIKQLKMGNVVLDKIINEKKTVITSLELSIKHWLRRYEKVQIENADLSDKCSDLQESHSKAEREIEEREKEIAALQEEVRIMKMKLEFYDQKSKLYPYDQNNNSGLTSNIIHDNFVNVICTLSQVIGNINKELIQERSEKEQCIRNLEVKEVEVKSLMQKLDEIVRAREKESLANAVQAQSFSRVKQCSISDSGARDLQNNIDNTSDFTESSTESSKMVSDLQKIIHYKNNTITTLKSDVIYKETLVAELENKLLNVTKELQTSKRHFHPLCDVKKSPSLGW